MSGMNGILWCVCDVGTIFFHAKKGKYVFCILWLVCLGVGFVVYGTFFVEIGELMLFGGMAFIDYGLFR